MCCLCQNVHTCNRGVTSGAVWGPLVKYSYEAFLVVGLSPPSNSKLCTVCRIIFMPLSVLLKGQELFAESVVVTYVGAKLIKNQAHNSIMSGLNCPCVDK